MALIKILGTGLTGLVGSRVVASLGDRYVFESISRETGVDITNRSLTAEKIENSDAEIVLHMGAKTDVDGCEKDKLLGKEGEAWRINVTGTENVVEAVRRTKKKLIFISTDFVFDGKEEQGEYHEDDKPNPTNWYGETKFQAEEIVKNADTQATIVRIAYPYRAVFEQKKDFVRAIAGRLKEGKQVFAIKDHIMTPTFIDDIARALDFLIQSDAHGFYHVVGSQYITPYDSCLLIAKTFGFDLSLIEPTTREVYFEGKAPRPFRLAISNDKIQKLGIMMKTFEEGLTEIKNQL